MYVRAVFANKAIHCFDFFFVLVIFTFTTAGAAVIIIVIYKLEMSLLDFICIPSHLFVIAQ
jgi:hypothetical protein